MFCVTEEAVYLLLITGYEVGCVSELRYQKATKMAKDIADSLDIMKSLSMPISSWKQLLNVPDVKQRDKVRRCVGSSKFYLNPGLIFSNI